MDQTWYLLGAAVVIVMMCIGVFGMYVGRGKKKRR
jgi:hypothetical protein